MIIIKDRNSIFFLIFFISLIFVACSSKKIKESVVKTCQIREFELENFKISDDSSITINLEFEDYFNSKNKYDVLNYSSKSGENLNEINRWYYKNDDTWIHVNIKNGVKSIKEIRLKESDIFSLFQSLQSKSYIKVCGNCFDCTSGLLMIKSEKALFKYYYDGLFYKDSDVNDREKITQIVKIYDFLEQK